MGRIITLGAVIILDRKAKFLFFLFQWHALVFVLQSLLYNAWFVPDLFVGVAAVVFAFRFDLIEHIPPGAKMQVNPHVFQSNHTS